MTAEENGIMADMYYYLRDHNDPPAIGTDACVAFWQRAATDAVGLINKWHNHPLAMDVGCAIYNYLESICKAKAREGDKIPVGMLGVEYVE